MSAGRAAAATAAPATRRRRAGRRKGSGTRSVQALSLVKGQPGITIPELAAKMGIKQNYLYRVLPALEQEGKITKQGRGWHPKS
jgi:predicted Rossmann fold nucleotide-binding protein DprA/Smf involved in DNA uptake